MRALSSLRHLFGHFGYADHQADENGVYWRGLRCVHCGRLTYLSVSEVQDRTFKFGEVISKPRFLPLPSRTGGGR